MRQRQRLCVVVAKVVTSWLLTKTELEAALGQLMCSGATGRVNSCCTSAAWQAALPIELQNAAILEALASHSVTFDGTTVLWRTRLLDRDRQAAEPRCGHLIMGLRRHAGARSFSRCALRDLMSMQLPVHVSLGSTDECDG